VHRIAVIALVLICALAGSSLSQADSSVTRAVAAVVQLDSVVITATRKGFDVEDFIRLVQEDESLYEAFRNLRTASYRFTTEMYFYDKHDKQEAEYYSKAEQVSDGRCREMSLLEEKFSDRFTKGRKEKYRYYTFNLYDRVFLTHGRVCEQSPSALDMQEHDDDRMEDHISELKRLIFTPGRRVNVPLIGRKTELFSERMLDYYDFHIRSDTLHGVPVYVFAAEVRKDFADKENKTVFKKLVTYFSKEDFQVVARNYRLSHNTVLYMFDVEMSVDLVLKGTAYYPARVTYSGTWNIPFKRRETGYFKVILAGFE
jgi:hypothetical protein